MLFLVPPPPFLAYIPPFIPPIQNQKCMHWLSLPNPPSSVESSHIDLSLISWPKLLNPNPPAALLPSSSACLVKKIWEREENLLGFSSHNVPQGNSVVHCTSESCDWYTLTTMWYTHTRFHCCILIHCLTLPCCSWNNMSHDTRLNIANNLKTHNLRSTLKMSVFSVALTHTPTCMWMWKLVTVSQPVMAVHRLREIS